MGKARYIITYLRNILKFLTKFETCILQIFSMYVIIFAQNIIEGGVHGRM